MTGQTMNLEAGDEHRVFELIGERFANIKPGTALHVRMPMDFGLGFLDAEEVADPGDAVTDGATLPGAANFASFARRHEHACTQLSLELLQEGDAFIAVLTMRKRPAAALN